MGHAGHLPDPDAFGVGLLRRVGRRGGRGRSRSAGSAREPVHPRGCARPRDEMGGGVSSIPGPCARDEHAVDRDAQSGPPVHEEAVEKLGVAVDGVDVRHQAGGRLRLARAAGSRGASGRRAGSRRRAGEQTTDLREDVEGPCVARVLEVAVALGCQQLEVDALHESSAVDTDLLGRHADPGVTPAIR